MSLSSLTFLSLPSNFSIFFLSLFFFFFLLTLNWVLITELLLFYVLFFWPWGLWDLCSLTKDWSHPLHWEVKFKTQDCQETPQYLESLFWRTLQFHLSFLHLYVKVLWAFLLLSALFYLAFCVFIRHNTFIEGNCLILCTE